MNEGHWSAALFDKPIQRVVRGWDDPDASYEFDMRDLVQTEDGWYVVATSGCSCPMPEDNVEIESGPSDLATLEAWFRAEFDNEKVTDYYRRSVADVLRAFAEAAA